MGQWLPEPIPADLFAGTGSALDTAGEDPLDRVTLDVGIAENDHDRVRVNRMIAENGMAAEIRMDGQLKAVIVPTVDDKGAVTLWAAMYEYDGRDFALVAEPQLVVPGEGRAEVELAGSSGNRFAFSIASSMVPKE